MVVARLKYVNLFQISCRYLYSTTTTTATCEASVVGGVRQYLVIFPQFTCQNTELNVMDVSILWWDHRYWSLLCIHNYPLSGSFTVGSPLFELKLTFSILLTSGGDNLLGVLIISQDSWLSLGNY